MTIGLLSLAAVHSSRCGLQAKTSDMHAIGVIEEQAVPF